MPKRALTALLPAALLLAACNPFKTDIKEAIVGRWESPTWTRDDDPVFAQFAADGTVKFLGRMRNTMEAEWLILESGELQTTYAAGFSRRCTIALSGDTLTLPPPTCLFGWDDLGGSIDLVKQ